MSFLIFSLIPNRLDSLKVFILFFPCTTLVDLLSSYLLSAFRFEWIRSPYKEVIQPHLPVRLPCYDFTPVTSPALGILLL